MYRYERRRGAKRETFEQKAQKASLCGILRKCMHIASFRKTLLTDFLSRFGQRQRNDLTKTYELAFCNAYP